MAGSSLDSARERTISNLFSGPIQRFEITLTPENLIRLRRQPHSDVKAKVRVGDDVFEEVAVHLKGQGSFRPLESRPSLTLHFGKFIRASAALGLKNFI
jgi:hypothetical protein